jgi:hypothetical protein
MDWQQYQASALYLAPGANPAIACVAYLIKPAANQPSTISLSDSLVKLAGWFVFVPAGMAADVAAFQAAALDFFGQSGREKVRFAWFHAFAGGQLTGETIAAVAAGATALSTTDRHSFTLGSQAVTLAPQNTIAVDGTATSLTFTAPQGSTNTYDATPNDGGSTLHMPFTAPLVLPLLAGSAPGCFTGSVVADHDALTSMDAGIRYFFDDPSWQGWIVSTRYPLLDLRSGGTQTAGDPTEITLAGSIDPVSPLDPDRTYFALPATPVRTFLANSIAEPIRLVPTTTAKFVLMPFVTALPGSEAAKAKATNGGGQLYLAPQGDFSVSPSATSTAPAGGSVDFTATLMCGLSGVEYLRLEAQSVLGFAPGAAYASAQYDTNGNPTFGPLASVASTSWMSAQVATQPMTYYAQPESAILHKPPAAPMGYAAGDDGGFLVYREFARGGAPPLFPVAPFGAVAGDAVATAIQFEQQVLAPSRAALMTPPQTPVPPPVFPTTLPNTVTPQGLLLDIEGANWATLTLAESLQADGSLLPMCLYNVRDALRAALLSNQVFLTASSGEKFLKACQLDYEMTQAVIEGVVLSDNLNQVDPTIATRLAAMLNAQGVFSALGQDSFQSAVMAQVANLPAAALADLTAAASNFKAVAGGWEIDLSPHSWETTGTILVMKFGPHSLTDLLADDQTWEKQGTFNDDPVATRQKLQSLIDSIKDDPIGAVIAGPNWNGIVAFQCRLPPTGMPDQLEGLAAGIDWSRFNMRYLEWTVTPVSTDGTTLTGHLTGFNGLIDYQDTTVPNPDDKSAYAYRVQQLKVVIREAAVADFSSKVLLKITALFGDGATCPNQDEVPQNCVLFNGVYQKTGAGGTYAFTTDRTYPFTIQGPVLDQFNIKAGVFATLTPSQTQKTEGDVHTQFQFQGTLRFKALSGFDVLSFDALAISALSVDMAFNANTPSWSTFTFNAQRVVCDVAASQARPASLWNNFPLKLAGLITGGAAARPDRGKWMPVDTPLDADSISDAWYALSFTINLGSPGGLAAKIDFTAGLVVAWSPGGSTPRLYVGLSLPGVSGGERAITLQSVIKLAFGDVAFTGSPASGGYVLVLRQVALKILSLSLPLGGTIDVMMFGGSTPAGRGTLGWYAAYLSNTASPPSLTSPKP